MIPHLVVVRVIEHYAFSFLPRFGFVAYTTVRKEEACVRSCCHMCASACIARVFLDITLFDKNQRAKYLNAHSARARPGIWTVRRRRLVGWHLVKCITCEYNWNPRQKTTTAAAVRQFELMYKPHTSMAKWQRMRRLAEPQCAAMSDPGFKRLKKALRKHKKTRSVSVNMLGEERARGSVAN